MSWVAVGAAAVTAGAGIYSSRQNKKSQDQLMDSANQRQDIAGDMRDYIKSYKKSLPGLLGTEREFRSKFQKINLGDIKSFLGTGPGTPGLISLAGKYQKQAGNQIGRARGRELEQMTNQTGLTRNLLQSMSPESAEMVAQANQQAKTAQQAAQGLTWQENRSAQQFAREGSADRGRTMDNSSIAGELLNRDSILGQKRQEAAAATQNAYNLSNSFYSGPGLQALSSMPNAYQAGNNYLGMGMGAVGQGTPQLINPDVAVNVGAANRQNQIGAAGAAAQMNASNNAAMMNAAGNMYGSYLQYKGTR